MKKFKNLLVAVPKFAGVVSFCIVPSVKFADAFAPDY